MQIKLSASVPAEEELLSTQALELSAGIATLAEAIHGSGLHGSGSETTFHEARALDLLGRKPLWSMSEFAREFSVTLSSASHTADKLVRKRTVKRGRSPQDRRVVLISLSGPGVKRQDALLQNRLRICTAILRQLSPTERESTLSSIQRLAATQRIEPK